MAVNEKVTLKRKSYTQIQAGDATVSVSLPKVAARRGSGDAVELIKASAAPDARTTQEELNDLGVYLRNKPGEDTGLLNMVLESSENLYGRWIGGARSSATVTLNENSSTTEGITITLRDDGGRDWQLDAAARRTSATLRNAVGRRNTTDADYFTLTLPAAVATPGDGRTWKLRIQRLSYGSGTTATAERSDDIIILTLGEDWAGSVTDAQSALATLDGIGGQDVAITGTAANAFEWDKGVTRDITFSAGAAVESINAVAAYNTLTVRYASTDTLDDILPVIEAVPGFDAVLTSGATGTNTAETLPVTDRDFASQDTFVIKF